MELTFQRFKSSKWLSDGRIQVRLVVRDEKATGTKSQTVTLIFSSSAELEVFAQSARRLEPLPPGVASANEMMMREAARAARTRRR